MRDNTHEPSAPARYDDSIGSLEIAALQAAYAAGSLTPEQVVAAIYDRIESRGDDAVWISLVQREAAIAAAGALGDPAGLPLYGIPFAVKDNIDVVGMPTTAGCPDFAYQPHASATIVATLLAAGAVLIGKTNLDQFATGLNGTRSPYGAPTTPFDDASISGGSSSGSAVAVSAGLVSFALGTDTAGSGRVPAALTGTVGVKPSRGLLSNTGVVPACRSLDCPSIFGLTVADASLVLSIAAGEDDADPWSRPLPVGPATPRGVDLAATTFGVPRADALGFSADSAFGEAWSEFLAECVAAGATLVEVDLAPFFAAGDLLYRGPWLAERLSGVEDFVTANPESVNPTVLGLLRAGASVSGTSVFTAINELLRLQKVVRPEFDRFDALLTPTTPVTFTTTEMLADPLVNNMALGRFTLFGNLLDLAAVAVPAAITREGMPFGVSVLGLAGADAKLACIAAAVERTVALPLAATGFAALGAPGEPDSLDSDGFDLAVVGAHLRGMPLHWQLEELGAQLIAETTTSADYRLFALETTPPKPGLARVPTGGSAIAVEVYRLAVGRVGEFIRRVSSPLAIGTLELADGSSVHGFVCEPVGIDRSDDITEFGGWRAYLASRASAV